MTPSPAAIDSAWLHCRKTRAEGRGGRAEGDEHRRESGDEQESGDENVAPRLRFALVDQSLDARPGEKAEIGRGERQDARADERDEARPEGRRDGDVGHGGRQMALRRGPVK